MFLPSDLLEKRLKESALHRCSYKKVFLKYAANRTSMPNCDFNSINLQSNFIEIALRHGHSPVNLLHTFRTHYRKTSGGLLLA